MGECRSSTIWYGVVRNFRSRMVWQVIVRTRAGTALYSTNWNKKPAYDMIPPGRDRFVARYNDVLVAYFFLHLGERGTRPLRFGWRACFAHIGNCNTAAGVAILLHRKHLHRVGQIPALNEKLVLDLHYVRRCVWFTSLYIPHARYSVEALRTVYDMLHVVLDEAERLHCKIIVGKDFNTELHVRHRGNVLDVLDKFACMWRLQKANWFHFARHEC